LFQDFHYLNISVIFAAPTQKGRHYFTKGGIKNMLIIDSKDCENIDKALKKYKKKFEKSKVLLQLRARQAFIKPSIKRRGEVLKAVYKQQMASGKFD
jgi:small subunit ribosomal protein S21